MVTQGVELSLLPSQLVAHCSGEPLLFALDGGGADSWGSGHALLGFRPRATLRVAPSGDALVAGAAVQRWHGDPFTLLDRFCAQCSRDALPAPHSFAGGIVVALSYDLRHWVERLPSRVRDDHVLPVLHAAYYDWLLSYSYIEHRYQLASVQRSRAELQDIAARFKSSAAAPAPQHNASARACVIPDLGQRQYLTAARTVLDYIGAGDVYQVNLAQRFVVQHPPPPAALFAAWQRQHAMPYSAYVDGGDFTLVSNSPECFLTRGDQVVATFPIKGTRQRGDACTDAAFVAELAGDPKERAEHVMIVDLERNDLGRVCRTGSVRVDDFARIKTFPSLHHMVSKVSGQLRPGTTLGALLRATFPGGSITGAPKIRAMQIIDEIEPVRRGFYTGAIGFIGLDGAAVFNLAIRTAVAAADTLTFHAGGGIVADSVPHREYDETLLKARAFFAALAAAA